MKKLSVFIFMFVAAFGLFAQVQSVGVTKSDVQNFAKNYEAMEEELEDYGSEIDDYAALSSEVTAGDVKAVERILAKYGISGSNPIQKVGVIATCMGITIYEKELSKDPQTAALMKQMGIDPTAEMKKGVSQQDYQVVASCYESFKHLYQD